LSDRPRGRAPLWVKLVAVALALAVALVLVIFAGRLLAGAVRLTRMDGGPTEPDPQFAEAAELVTRPPELNGEGDAAAVAGDPSANWDLGEQTPVDKTARELAAEAAGT